VSLLFSGIARIGNWSFAPIAKEGDQRYAANGALNGIARSKCRERSD
jgi:hypothetical protein